MKKIVTIIAVVIASMVLANAQDNKSGKTYTKDGTTFVQQKSSRGSSSQEQPTSYTWRDSKGNEYPIFLHTYSRGEKAGRTTCYVLKTSAKTGKEYKYYIPGGEEMAQEIMGETK